jgi:hypothetical protein
MNMNLLKMEQTQCSETSAFNTQTPGKYPEDNLSLKQHGESLKTRTVYCYISRTWVALVLRATEMYLICFINRALKLIDVDHLLRDVTKRKQRIISRDITAG